MIRSRPAPAAPGLPPPWEELQALRRFLEEHTWNKAGPAGMCIRTTAVLHRLYGGERVGGWPKADHRTLDSGFLDLRGNWRMHYWLHLGGHLIDLTADQFSGGPPVICTATPDARYRVCSTPRDVQEDFQSIRRSTETAVRAWTRQRQRALSTPLACPQPTAGTPMVLITGSAPEVAWLQAEHRAAHPGLRVYLADHPDDLPDVPAHSVVYRSWTTREVQDELERRARNKHITLRLAHTLRGFRSGNAPDLQGP